MRRTLNSLFRACSLHLTLLMNAVSLTGRLLSALRLFRLLVRCFIGGKEEKESGPSRNCGRITSGGFNVDSEPLRLIAVAMPSRTVDRPAFPWSRRFQPKFEALVATEASRFASNGSAVESGICKYLPQYSRR